MEKISPQIRHQLAQFQHTQQQAQVLMSQKQQLEILLHETERAFEDLQKLADDAVVYKSVGTVMVKYDKKKLEGELGEQRETLGLRIKTVVRQEERTIQRLNEMREKLDQAMKGGEPPVGAS